MSEFNPTEHNAKDTLEYLATVTDQAEVERVQAAESGRTDGKNARKTVLDFRLPAPQESAPEPKADPEAAPDPDASQPEVQPEPEAMKALPLKEAVKGTPDLEGEAYQQGYQGTSPADDAGETEDLTLPAVLRRMGKGN